MPSTLATPAPLASAAPAFGLAGAWSRPPDAPSKVALALAAALLLAALVPAGAAWLASLIDFSGVVDLHRRRRFLAVSGFVAAFLSLGYIAYYLHGGPRDALAPAYWLQGRVLSHGELSWATPDPSASFRAGPVLGRFEHTAGVFPPGYPMLLAVGFLVGAPMLVGPLLAALLVLATWALARELAEGQGLSELQAEAVARVAVGLSILSAAMRLHSADTLPFGATAAGVTIALAAALRGRRIGDRRFLVLAAFAVGAVAATHPASAVAVGAVVAALLLGARDRRTAIWSVVAVVPGVLLLMAAHKAAIGRLFASPVSTFFATVALPAPKDVHPTHAGLVSFLMRFRAHLADIDNLEPLALLVLVPLLGRGRSRAVSLAGLVIVGQIVVAGLVAAPARGEGIESTGASLVAIIPVEQALLALALARLAPRALPQAALVAFALGLAGFSVHAVNAHRRVTASGVGRPHFEPDLVRDAGVSNGLLYFDDDQGFALAFDPAVPASHGIEAVRLRGDDHDRLVFDMMGHPPIHKYNLANPPSGQAPANPPGGQAEATSSVVSWAPPNAGSDTWRFEAESDWPPPAWTGGQVEITEGAPSCASDGHGLSLTPTAFVSQGTASASASAPAGSSARSLVPGLAPPSGSSSPAAAGSASATGAAPGGPAGPASATEATMTIALPVPRGPNPPERRTWTVAPRVLQRGGAGLATLELVTSPGAPPLARWTWEDAARTAGCFDLPPQSVELGGDRPRAWLVLHASGGSVTLDKTTLRPK